MSQKKTFYRYNPVTESYDRVYPSRGARFWGVARQCIAGMCTGVILFFVLYNVMEFPREKLMKMKNERMEQTIEMLDRRSDEALAVMLNLQQRDNNFYRVMMQAEPLSDAARYAGLERQRNYESLDSLADNELVHTVSEKLDRLDNMVYNQIKSYDFLREQAAGMKERINNIPAIQPISSKYLKTMASGYGYRHDPIYGTSKFHEGMDFSSAIGTPVYATGAGTVKSAGWESGYGNSIDIDHGFSYLTRYAHLSQILVKEGQSVKRGDLIGKVGNTGKSTGPHLHYEVRYRGAPQNPVNYYFMDLTPEQYDEMIIQAENAGHVMD